MLRRIVDTAIPAACLAGSIPPIFGADLPGSVDETLGGFGWWWALLFAVASASVITGIWLRRPIPRWSLIFEWPGCILAGGMGLIYSIAIANRFGTESWSAICYMGGLGLYFLARFGELAHARWLAVKGAT